MYAIRSYYDKKSFQKSLTNAKRCDSARMFRAEDLPPNGERLLVERLGLGIAALVHVKQRQVVA